MDQLRTIAFVAPEDAHLLDSEHKCWDWFGLNCGSLTPEEWGLFERDPGRLVRELRWRYHMEQWRRGEFRVPDDNEGYGAAASVESSWLAWTEQTNKRMPVEGRDC